MPPKQIACSACRKRKQRCNRQTPCDECIRRGVPSQCRPDFRKAGPSNTALNNQVQGQAQRLQSIENFLSAQFPNFDPLKTILSPSAEAEDSPQEDGNNDIGGIADDINQQDPYEEQPESASSLLQQNGFDFGPILASFQDYSLFNPNDTSSTLTPSTSLFSSVRSTSPYFQSFAWTQHLLSHLLALLPQPGIVHSMVNFYFAKNSMRSVHGISSIQFNAELVEFEQARQMNQAHEADPAWLALLFIVMSAGIVIEYETHGHVLGASDSTQMLQLVDTFAHCAHGALAAANWATTPNLRVVQALAVLAWGSQYNDAKTSTYERDNEQQLHRVAIALQHCRKFGLDKLGSDPETMPASDPAFGSSHSGFRRQMALRLWHDYKMMESLAASYLIDRKECTTVDPMLCREEDLGWSTFVAERTFQEEPNMLYMFGQRALSEHLSKFHATRVRPEAQLQDYQNLADEHTGNSDRHIAILQTIPASWSGPSVLGSKDAYTIFCNMNKFGGLLRLWRAAMSHFRRRPADFAVCEVKAKQAAINVVGCLTKPLAASVTRRKPFAITFLLNACVLLVAALMKEDNHISITMYFNLLKSTVEVCQDALEHSRARSIRANADRALAVISAFAQKIQDLEVVRTGALSHHTGDIAILAQQAPPRPMWGGGAGTSKASAAILNLPGTTSEEYISNSNDWTSLENYLLLQSPAPQDHELFLEGFVNNFEFWTSGNTGILSEQLKDNSSQSAPADSLPNNTLETAGRELAVYAP